MQIQQFIPILFLAGYFTLSAQTNTTPAPALLTSNQAVTLAAKLANKEFKEKYIDTGNWAGSNAIYSTNIVLNSNGQNIGTQIHTDFNGYWVITLSEQAAFGMYNDATVEIAADGSTSSVKFTRTATYP